MPTTIHGSLSVTVKQIAFVGFLDAPTICGAHLLLSAQFMSYVLPFSAMLITRNAQRMLPTVLIAEEGDRQSSRGFPLQLRRGGDGINGDGLTDHGEGRYLRFQQFEPAIQRKALPNKDSPFRQNYRAWAEIGG
jgi:hypothetical protein